MAGDFKHTERQLGLVAVCLLLVISGLSSVAHALQADWVLPSEVAGLTRHIESTWDGNQPLRALIEGVCFPKKLPGLAWTSSHYWPRRARKFLFQFKEWENEGGMEGEKKGEGGRDREREREKGRHCEQATRRPPRFYRAREDTYCWLTGPRSKPKKRRMRRRKRKPAGWGSEAWMLGCGPSAEGCFGRLLDPLTSGRAGGATGEM